MNKINYVIGDATRPNGCDTRIIAHGCNDIGCWGAGFVLALSAVSTRPEADYHLWHTFHKMGGSTIPFEGGRLILSPFPNESDIHGQIMVASMITQHGVGLDENGSIPLRYVWLAQCFNRLRVIALYAKASVHMPRIGCGLAHGNWESVEELINLFLVRKGVPVTIYDLP